MQNALKQYLTETSIQHKKVMKNINLISLFIHLEKCSKKKNVLLINQTNLKEVKLMSNLGCTCVRNYLPFNNNANGWLSPGLRCNVVFSEQMGNWCKRTLGQVQKGANASRHKLRPKHECDMKTLKEQ